MLTGIEKGKEEGEEIDENYYTSVVTDICFL